MSHSALMAEESGSLGRLDSTGAIFARRSLRIMVSGTLDRSWWERGDFYDL